MHVRTIVEVGGPIRKIVERLPVLFEERRNLKETFKVALRDQVRQPAAGLS